MLEKYLIRHCAPTLASLKTAAMFAVEIPCDMELKSHIDMFNTYFKEKGLIMTLLRRRGENALIYVYRRSHLCADLRKTGVGCFLSKYGYGDIEVENVLSVLKNRLAESETFPHEIGVFLGYPLCDVMGFIENEGKNCKCVGSWKVYGDESEAEKRFARFKKCKNVYAKLWTEGRSVLKLTVAA